MALSDRRSGLATAPYGKSTVQGNMCTAILYWHVHVRHHSISQQSVNGMQGYIETVNYADGSFTINGNAGPDQRSCNPDH